MKHDGLRVPRRMDEPYKFIDNRGGYDIYRKIENGRGVWRADGKDGKSFPITYHQALGYEPIDRQEAMRKALGKMMFGGTCV